MKENPDRRQETTTWAQYSTKFKAITIIKRLKD